MPIYIGHTIPRITYEKQCKNCICLLLIFFITFVGSTLQVFPNTLQFIIYKIIESLQLFLTSCCFFFYQTNYQSRDICGRCQSWKVKLKYVIVFLQACLTSLASWKKVARGATRQNSLCVTLIGPRAKYSATEMHIRPSAMFLYIGNIITFHGMNIQELPCFI